MEIEICSQCRGLILDPGETVYAISNELAPLWEISRRHIPTTLKMRIILWIVLGMVMLQIYVLMYFFG